MKVYWKRFTRKSDTLHYYLAVVIVVVQPRTKQTYNEHSFILRWDATMYVHCILFGITNPNRCFYWMLFCLSLFPAFVISKCNHIPSIYCVALPAGDGFIFSG